MDDIPKTARRSDLLIGMTLAELFLLLLFTVWYSIFVSGPTPGDPKILQIENERLTRENAKLRSDLTDCRKNLDDLNERLRWWREHYPDTPYLNSIEAVKSFCADVGRGKPRCQTGASNLLVEVLAVHKDVSLRLLTDAPQLADSLGSWGVSHVKAGTVLSRTDDIERFLQGVRGYRLNDREGPRECRFDYDLIYGDHEDYFYARERFEKFFYSGGRSQASRKK
jgi:hypothetical protein